MRQLFSRITLTLFLISGLYGFSLSQDLSWGEIEKIETEITLIFDKSIKAGEQLDLTGISDNTNDSLKTGFIDNGHYFNSFEELMSGFKSGIHGLVYQKMNVETKKITVLSKNSVLLTAHGNYSAKVIDGRILTGRFAWTFVYCKINGKWNVIHSHMSNPKS